MEIRGIDKSSKLDCKQVGYCTMSPNNLSENHELSENKQRMD